MEQNLSRRERKKQETRDRILSVARKMIENQGFGATTLEQIAEGADVSKATFYNYFPNKTELLEAILAIETEAVARRIAGEWDDSASPLSVMRRAMDMVFSGESSLSPISQRIVLEYLLHPDKLPKPIVEMGGMAADLIRQAQEQGELPADLDPTRINEAIGCAYLSASIFVGFTGRVLPSAGEDRSITTIAAAMLETTGIDWPVDEDV